MERLREIELGQTLADRPEPPSLRLHPSLGARYRSGISRLSEALQAPGMKREAPKILRSLISEVWMIPEAGAPGGHRMELMGDLAGILRLAEDGVSAALQLRGTMHQRRNPRGLRGMVLVVCK